eukprot:scaffold58821_cov63-Phaeocystis_antarctica.AAC.1
MQSLGLAVRLAVSRSHGRRNIASVVAFCPTQGSATSCNAACNSYPLPRNLVPQFRRQRGAWAVPVLSRCVTEGLEHAPRRTLPPSLCSICPQTRGSAAFAPKHTRLGDRQSRAPGTGPRSLSLRLSLAFVAQPSPALEPRGLRRGQASDVVACVAGRAPHDVLVALGATEAGRRGTFAAARRSVACARCYAERPRVRSPLVWATSGASSPSKPPGRRTARSAAELAAPRWEQERRHPRPSETPAESRGRKPAAPSRGCLSPCGGSPARDPVSEQGTRPLASPTCPASAAVPQTAAHPPAAMSPRHAPAPTRRDRPAPRPAS